MANVFVSGQIGDVTSVRRVQAAFRAAGHTITHDWTRNETGDQLLGGRQAKFDQPEESARRAVKDMQGVIDCDVYVICTDNQAPGKGMYVELGAALALHATKDTPQIYLVGEMAHASIFYFHPAVVRCQTVDDVIRRVSSHK